MSAINRALARKSAACELSLLFGAQDLVKSADMAIIRCCVAAVHQIVGSTVLSTRSGRKLYPYILPNIVQGLFAKQCELRHKLGARVCTVYKAVGVCQWQPVIAATAVVQSRRCPFATAGSQLLHCSTCSGLPGCVYVWALLCRSVVRADQRQSSTLERYH